MIKFGADEFLLQMSQNLLFEQTANIRLSAFYSTPLGHPYQAVPFDSLLKQIPSPKKLSYGKGCKPGFDMKGGIALQILKSHLRRSDAMLVEVINGNWMMQMFCCAQLRGIERIKDKDIVGRWRKYMRSHLDIENLKIACVQYWKPYMQDVQAGFCDATVYESYITYPTDSTRIRRTCSNVLAMLQQVHKIKVEA